MKRFHFVLISFFGLGLVLFGTAQTRLNIDRQGTDVVISWPSHNATNSVLQQTPTLASSNWTRVPLTPLFSSGSLYVVVPPTNAASFFRLVIDEPDDAFTDLDGDGIDGTASMAIFVAATGNDSNPGTMSQPVQSIARGIANAVAQGRKHVYIAKGQYQSGTIAMVDGVSLFGGYDAANWSRSGANIVQLQVTDPTALVVDNVRNATTLDALYVRGGDAALGQSAYGLFVRNSPGLIVRRTTVQAGNAGAGISGANGPNGNNGGNGFMGSPGCEDSAGFCGSCSRPQGGAGGTSACGRTGGRGGLPGHAGSFGTAGLSGAGGTPGGPGTPPGQNNWNTPSSYWGANGTNGGPGTNGAAAGDFALSPDGYAPSIAASGATGIPGNGGGGGGGGGGGDDNCDSYGGAGGGGGAGGCGGVPGAGGQSGGASVPVYLWSSNIKLENCALISGSGGNGGAGGTGGPGGTGGLGGRNSSLSGAGNPYGGSGEQEDGSNGGRGGDGGNGGPGGHGGGGAGGPSIALVRGGGSVPEISSVTFTLGTGGAGGASPANPGPQGQAFNVYP